MDNILSFIIVFVAIAYCTYYIVYLFSKDSEKKQGMIKTKNKPSD